MVSVVVCDNCGKTTKDFYEINMTVYHNDNSDVEEIIDDIELQLCKKCYEEIIEPMSVKMSKIYYREPSSIRENVKIVDFEV